MGAPSFYMSRLFISPSLPECLIYNWQVRLGGALIRRILPIEEMEQQAAGILQVRRLSTRWSTKVSLGPDAGG